MPRKTQRKPVEANDPLVLEETRFAAQPVTLKKAHTHAGKRREAGEEIRVTDAATLAFLAARGIV
ncbi:MAG: hypothetical protein LBD68_09835 [Zoogloeaceae bacterium]|jgi:hypothetical protein|nr:hypothetical protein [Zoogloeaceae bacterium]